MHYLAAWSIQFINRIYTHQSFKCLSEYNFFNLKFHCSTMFLDFILYYPNIASFFR